MFARYSYQNYKSEPDRAPFENELNTTNDSPFLGLAGNWNRIISKNSLNELLVGFTHVKFQTIPTDWAGIGNANATIGIPGGQPIPGLSLFDIPNAGFGSAATSEFNDIKSYQVNEKFSLFKGRHQFKFGGRWLYQQQGFSYSGNEGTLGHFDYNGSFTGFGFSDFLLDQASAKEQLAAAEAQFAAATQAVDVAQQRYRAGASSLIEITQARATQTQAASALATAKNNLALQGTVMAYYTGELKAESR